MEAPTNRTIVRGSERAPQPDAWASRPSPPDEQLEVTVRIRPKTAPDALAPTAFADLPPQDRTYLSRDELDAQLGAAPQDMDAVMQFARASGLTVVRADMAQRSVVVAGPAAAFEAAFGTVLHQYESTAGRYRGRTGPLTVPAPLSDIVEGVFGLDNRPQARPHFRVRGPSAGAIAARSATGSFTPPALAKLYNFPTGTDGTGQCIAIIELGGGFRPEDLTAYFTRLGLPVPAVATVSIDGGLNQPTTAQGADGEVMLDIEVAAAVAPGARIAVYFAPNTTQGFLNAIIAAVHDKVNQPTVISISWGAAESSWTAQAMDQYDQAFQAAALIGVTVCCAAGDNGSGDGVADGQPHVDFPASSPFALACGGTKLTAAGGKIGSEVVWNEGPNSATGGGISNHFPVPAYQKSLALPKAAKAKARKAATSGRALPDVAGDADPQTGYEVRVDGQDLVIGGTSAVAPLWAGLVALLNHRLGRPAGFLNPLLYGSLAGKGVFHDIVSGTNGAYTASAGWDACTGWGSPDGSALLAALAPGPPNT